MTKELEAEPTVIFEGVKSDASEHEPMLDNPSANRNADAVAAGIARSIGLSDEQIKKYIG